MKRGLVLIPGLIVFISLTACESPRRERVVVSQRPVVVHERERVRAPVVIRQSPPPAIREVIPTAPGRRYVWTPGYWVWDGQWLWQSGQWVLPPRDRANWVPGHWVDHRGEWEWVPGQWR